VVSSLPSWYVLLTSLDEILYADLALIYVQVRKRAREAAKAQAISKGLIPAKKTRGKKAVNQNGIAGNES
jgi:hypothetical protein